MILHGNIISNDAATKGAGSTGRGTAVDADVNAFSVVALAARATKLAK
jgi:hypothetical protein